MWQAFINEWSFNNAQIFDPGELGRSVAKFVKLIDATRTAIDRAPEHRRLYRSDRLELTRTCGNQAFPRLLNQLRNREHREQLIDLIRNRTNPIVWEDEQVSTVDGSYLWKDAPSEYDDTRRNIANTSMAELAERRIQDEALTGCLLNLSSSPLAARCHIDIDVQGNSIRIDSLDDAETLQRWLETIDQVCPYPTDEHDPPTDAQTCLVKPPYKPSSLLNQGRKLYQHNTNGHYACVDNMHYGLKAHLEIFDKRGNHLYEAELNGMRRPNTRDPKKSLAL